MIEVRRPDGTVERRAGIEFLAPGETFRVPMAFRNVSKGELVERIVVHGVWLVATGDPRRVEQNDGKLAWAVACSALPTSKDN